MHIKGFCGSAQIAFHDWDQLNSSRPSWECCGATKCHIAPSDDKRWYFSLEVIYIAQLLNNVTAIKCQYLFIAALRE